MSQPKTNSHRKFDNTPTVRNGLVSFSSLKELEKKVLQLEIKLERLEEKFTKVVENILADNDQSRIKALEARVRRLERMNL
jgi:hypothetical protein